MKQESSAVFYNKELFVKIKLWLLSVLVVLLFSCEENQAGVPDDLKGALSSEGNIVSIVIDGVEAKADINRDTKRITIDVPPIDIRGKKLKIGLSEGAKILEIPALKDGETVKFVVEAEDGTKEEWMVKANVLPGASFTLDGTRYVFMKGCIDSVNSEMNTEIGNGVPYVTILSDKYYHLGALKENFDFKNDYDPRDQSVENCFNLVVEKLDTSAKEIVTTREYTVPGELAVEAQYTMNDSNNDSKIECYKTNSLKISFLSISEAPGENFQAVFSGIGTVYSMIEGDILSENVKLTDGFIKVIQVPDPEPQS